MQTFNKYLFRTLGKKYVWLVSHVHPQQILQKWNLPWETSKRKFVKGNSFKNKMPTAATVFN